MDVILLARLCIIDVILLAHNKSAFSSFAYHNKFASVIPAVGRQVSIAEEVLEILLRQERAKVLD